MLKVRHVRCPAVSPSADDGDAARGAHASEGVLRSLKQNVPAAAAEGVRGRLLCLFDTPGPTPGGASLWGAFP